VPAKGSGIGAASSPRNRGPNGEAAVAQVHVEDGAEAALVPVDEERLVVREAVQVQVQVGPDVEGKAAVPEEDDAELVVVRELVPKARSLDAGSEERAHHEGVGLVEGNDALVPVLVRGSKSRSSPLPTTRCVPGGPRASVGRRAVGPSALL
jgi:hypothetical protein